MTFFCNTFKRFYIMKDKQAVVFLDTFFAPLSMLHSCPRNLYEVVQTLIMTCSYFCTLRTRYDILLSF